MDSGTEDGFRNRRWIQEQKLDSRGKKKMDVGTEVVFRNTRWIQEQKIDSGTEN